MLVSPLTATIYLPLLPLLSTQFHVSLQAINLTVTVYIIFQALSPLFLASLSDHLGRRPLYLSTFALYTLASLGLTLNKSNYAVLIVLRALQSLGASAVLSVSYGTIADICVPARRGKMLGPVLAAGNVGTCVGPLIGGWIAFKSSSFRWVFWALVIYGAGMLAALALLMPETARFVVGNGSVNAHQRWNQPLWKMMVCPSRWRRRLAANRTCQVTGPGKYEEKVTVDCQSHDQPPIGTGNPSQSSPSTPTLRRSFKMTSSLDAIRIIFYADTSLIIWVSSSFYALWYCIQASIPSTYQSAPYGFNELEVGLAYLPGAIGVILSMYLTGKAMDHNYRGTAAESGFAVDTVRGDDLAEFPIERARSRGCGYLLVLSSAVTVGYGWAIARRAHVAVPLLLQFVQGFLATWLVQCFSALLVDVFPDTPSMAATAGNVTKCVLAAGAVAVLEPLVDVIGKGWFFSLVGILCGVGGLISVMALRRWGMAWRKVRGARTRQKQQQQQKPRDDRRDDLHVELCITGTDGKAVLAPDHAGKD
ncbi:hypothetical protein MMC16_004559 [Acarospora aff. strigata]|nr:hypothetical protein [Acarospora aff. strigata]